MSATTDWTHLCTVDNLSFLITLFLNDQCFQNGQSSYISKYIVICLFIFLHNSGSMRNFQNT